LGYKPPYKARILGSNSLYGRNLESWPAFSKLEGVDIGGYDVQCSLQINQSVRFVLLAIAGFQVST